MNQNPGQDSPLTHAQVGNGRRQRSKWGPFGRMHLVGSKFTLASIAHEPKADTVSKHRLPHTAGGPSMPGIPGPPPRGRTSCLTFSSPSASAAFCSSSFPSPSFVGSGTDNFALAAEALGFDAVCAFGAPRQLLPAPTEGEHTPPGPWKGGWGGVNHTGSADKQSSQRINWCNLA